MTVLVKVQSQDGALLFESDSSEQELEEIGRFNRDKDLVKDTGMTSASIATTIRGSAQQLLATVDHLAQAGQPGAKLASAQLELGIRLTAEGNVIVAKGTAEANLKVSLTWNFT